MPKRGSSGVAAVTREDERCSGSACSNVASWSPVAEAADSARSSHRRRHSATRGLDDPSRCFVEGGQRRGAT
jgi:hypothetical protein